MVISSRTPEGQSDHCLVCGSDQKIEPAHPPGVPHVLDADISSGLRGKTWETSRS